MRLDVRAAEARLFRIEEKRQPIAIADSLGIAVRLPRPDAVRWAAPYRRLEHPRAT